MLGMTAEQCCAKGGADGSSAPAATTSSMSSVKSSGDSSGKSSGNNITTSSSGKSWFGRMWDSSKNLAESTEQHARAQLYLRKTLDKNTEKPLIEQVTKALEAYDLAMNQAETLNDNAIKQAEKIKADADEAFNATKAKQLQALDAILDAVKADHDQNTKKK